MHQRGWRSIIAVIAAAWFLIVALNLASYGDPVALALTDLGRAILVGLAILSLRLVDLDWAIERARDFGRYAARPTT